MGRHHSTRAPSTFAALGTVFVLGLTACASSDNKASSATDAQAAPASTAAAADTAAPAGDVSLTGADPSATTEPSAAEVSLDDASPLGAALAIEATVTVEVDDVREAVIDLPNLVADAGGAIYNTDIAVGEPATAKATITIKVPPTGLESLVSGLGGLGRMLGRTQTAEDVADQIADTTSRITTARASVDRVRVLLASATDLDAVVQIESELTLRETALEQLLASQRNLTDRVQLATLTVVLVPTPVEVAAPVNKDEPNSVGRALRSGWHTFVDALHGTVVVLAYIAPLLVLTAIAGLVVLVTRRKRPAA